MTNNSHKEKIYKWLGIVGSVIGIVGFFYGEYQRVESTKQKIPVFYIDHSKVSIIDKNEFKSSEIKVFTKNGDEIKSNLYAVKFFFWNNGKEAIMADDILEKLKINLKNSKGRIIDFRILSQSRKNICNFKLSKINKESLLISFNVIENKDGFSGQIIYEGDKSAELKITGAILDAKIINDYNSEKERAKIYSVVTFAFLITFASFVLAILPFPCLLQLLYIIEFKIEFMKKQLLSSKKDKILWINFIVISIIYMFLFLNQSFRNLIFYPAETLIVNTFNKPVPSTITSETN